MNKSKIHIILKTLLSLALISYLLFIFDFEQLKSLKINIIKVIFLSVFITLISLFMMALRWKIIISAVKINSNIKYLYITYIKASFYNIFFPGAIGGDIIRTRAITQKYDLSIKKATTITVIERLSGLYVLFIIGSIGLLYFNPPLKILNLINITYLKYILFLLILLIPLFKILLNQRIKLEYKIILPTLVLSLIGQLGDITIAWLFCKNLNIDLSYIELLTVMPVVYFVTVLPISLGGIGVREGVFVAILSLYSINNSTSILISFLMYFIKILIGIIGWVFIISHKKNE